MSGNICEYKTLKALSKETLEKAVNKLLQEGWQTFGESFKITEDYYCIVAQPMIKYQT